MLNKSTGDVVGMKEELGRMLASVITLRGARGRGVWGVRYSRRMLGGALGLK